MKLKGTEVFFLGAFFVFTATCRSFSLDLDALGSGLAFSAKRSGYPTIYLAGTVHSLPEHQQIPPSVYISIFHLADRVGFEYDSREAASSKALPEKFFPSPEKTVASLFSPELLESLRRFCERDDLLDYKHAISASPVYTHFLVMQTLNSRSGISVAFGTDSVFRSAAESDGKPLLFLESAEDQISAFEKLGTHYFESRILDRVSETPEAHRADCDHLYSLWRDGAANHFEAATVKEMPEEFLEHILLERNREWIPRILSQARAEDSPIAYFVGAAHLLGKDGLVELLENEGFAVTQVVSSSSLIPPVKSTPGRSVEAAGPSGKLASSRGSDRMPSKPTPLKKKPKLFRGFRSVF